MSNYGRNFEFRVSPRHGDRSGRYYVGGSTAIPIGAPVVTNGTVNSAGQQEVVLATGATAKPLPGKGGILIFEWAPDAWKGLDPLEQTYSDFTTAPVGAVVQVVGGADVKVCLRNTSDSTFLNTRAYTGKTMVTDLSASVGVGEYLTAGAGNDDDGYWALTSTAANIWLVVTRVDTNRGEVEARLNF